MEILVAIWAVLNTPLTQVQERDLTLLSVLQVILIIVLALVAGRAAGRLVRTQAVRRIQVTASAGASAARTVRITAAFVGLYLALTSIGFDLAILLVPIGGLSVGIGLGMQDLAKNLVGGAVTLTEGRVQRGQRIEVRGMQGVVEGIGLRTTTILMDDGVHVLLPNGDFMTQPIKLNPEEGGARPQAELA